VDKTGSGLQLGIASATPEKEGLPALTDYQIQQNSLPFDSRIGLYLHNTIAYVSMQIESGGIPTDYLDKFIFDSRFANNLC